MSDPILLWNEVALQANRVSHTNGKMEQTGPARSSRALAIVHLAMYDAYAGVINQPAQLPPYINSGISPGSSLDAAVAAAAHRTLSVLFPSQKPFFNSVLAAAGDKGDPGHNFGLMVADAILEDRGADPGPNGDYTPSLKRGKHRPDPDNPMQGFDAPLYGAKSKGFAVTKRYELAAPPFGNGSNPKYTEALMEVRSKGIAPELVGTLPAGSSARTAVETLIGIYWGYDGSAELGTPPRFCNQIVRQVAINKPNPGTGKPNNPAQNARLFAFVNVALADAAILAWDQKYRHNFWRPVVGIREHDLSIGPSAKKADVNDMISIDGDPSWLPLGAPNTNSLAKNFTPNFPAYPSGHATFGAAAFHITRLFYGVAAGDRQPDNLPDGLGIVSEEFNGTSRDNKGTVRPRHVRKFKDGLWGMIEEIGRSRVYLGVHWVFDAFATEQDGTTPDLDKKVNGKPIGGVPLGLQIAEDIFDAMGGKGPKKSTVDPRS